MPMIQIPLDPKDYKAILKVKARHGHTWAECLLIYADIYAEIEAKK